MNEDGSIRGKLYWGEQKRREASVDKKTAFKLDLFNLFDQGFTPANITNDQLANTPILSTEGTSNIPTRIYTLTQMGKTEALKFYYNLYLLQKENQGK